MGLNKQGRLVDGRVVGGIEWVKTVLPDGNEQQGATANPVGGCFHACRWRMPDKTIAECYAETTAEGAAQRAYPQGFQHHYWRPQVLDEIQNQKTPMRIFTDSMSDLMGRWVSDDEIQQCLAAYAKADWHTFLILTKNAPRLREFEFPGNVHVGVSSPPDFMWGHELTPKMQDAMLRNAFRILANVKARVRWVSFEPLSRDYAALAAEYPGVLQWAVIGAASRGRQYFQPNPAHVAKLRDALRAQGVKIFYKGNLRGNPAAEPWLEEFPDGV